MSAGATREADGASADGAATRRAYLDHAATTALRPAAREAFLAASEVLGNPTAVHASGRAARRVHDDALDSIASDLGVPRSWVILTSGGTEADNIALRGGLAAARAREATRRRVAVCATDHPAALETARALGDLRVLPVGRDGRMDLAALEAALSDRSVAVLSVALANNETGILQDLSAIAGIAREAGTVVHTDAVQAIGHADLPSFREVPLLSLTGHKIGAPVGIGALAADPEVPVAPVTTGGGQQRGVRPGTLDAAHAAALAAALHETLRDAEAERARLRALGDRLRAGIARIDPSARLTAAPGVPVADHIVHVLFPGAEAQSLLFLLDERGVDASAGSACAAGVTTTSSVLEAMGIEPELAHGALRLSLGWTTREADIDLALLALPAALERSRAVAALARRETGA